MNAASRLRGREVEGIVESTDPGQGYHDAVLISERERDLLANLAESVQVVLDYENKPSASSLRQLRSDLITLDEELGGTS